jgi:hypothetical protein
LCSGVPAGRGGVGAQGQDGGGDHLGGRGDEVHQVRVGHAGGLESRLVRMRELTSCRAQLRSPAGV